jgi:hypothetical protein
MGRAIKFPGTVPDELADDVNALYKLPLAEFTAARNALARRAGDEGATIKTLEKPTAPAWAVNQLYWRKRKTYDRLIAAKVGLHGAHAARLGGKKADVEAAEAAHQAVLREAADQIREILQESGDAATPATLSAVAETLQGLPGSEPPGRLTRPLKPQGFEVLSSLLQSSGRAGGKLADIVHFTSPKARAPVAGTTHEDRAARDKAQKAREAALEKQAAAARAREAAKIETQLGDAQRAEREAEKALADGQKALARTERQHTQLQEELSAAAERLDELTIEVKRLQQRADAAAIARKRLQDQLAGLRES